MQQFISPAILGMFQTVTIPQSQLRCCAVGAVRAVCEADSGFQKQLLALWCLHVGSLLHTDVAQPPRSQMTPLAWCPIADSEQSSRVTDRRARCADLYISAQKNQFLCMYVGPRSQWGLEGVVDWTQMDPQLSPTLPPTWDSTWSPCTLCDCRRCRIC